MNTIQSTVSKLTDLVSRAILGKPKHTVPFFRRMKEGEDSRTRKNKDGIYLVNGYPVKESIHPLIEWFENAKTK